MNRTIRLLSFISALLLLSACTLTISTKIEPVEDKKKEEVKEEAKEEPAEEVEPAKEEEAEPEKAEEEEKTAEDTDDAVVEDDKEADEAADKVPAEEATEPRVIQVTADNWAFTPNVITVKQGEKVTISLKGMNGTHGFSVPGLGINVPVSPGETSTVELPTDKAGTYDLVCSIPCGAGHKDMTGQIVIEE